jgi:hypothetical protein
LNAVIGKEFRRKSRFLLVGVAMTQVGQSVTPSQS